MRSSADPPSRTKMNFGSTLLDPALRPNLKVKERKIYSLDLLPQPLPQHLIHHLSQNQNYALKDNHLLYYRENRFQKKSPKK